MTKLKMIPVILYMEDDPDDLELLRYSLQMIDVDVEIIHTWNGDEGLKKLKELKRAGNLPSMILLDINMPRLNGKEVFNRILDDEELAKIPVAVLSTSTNNPDKSFFHRFNVPMLNKPGDLQPFIMALKQLLKNCFGFKFVSGSASPVGIGC